MSAASDLRLAHGLRVLVHAVDPARRDALLALVRDWGHQSVDALGAADVVLCDGDGPGNPNRPVLALGGLDTDQAGWLPRDAPAVQIHAALGALAAGLTVRSQSDPDLGFGAMPEHSLQGLLTPREMEVLDAVGDGLTNKMIARRLDISLHTVKFHVESLFRKLGVRTRTEALAKAHERLRNILEL